MPTYAYACTVCGHTFDIQQSFTDDSLTICPQCQGKLRKVFSSVGVSFKGSGFYRNDSRAGSKSSNIPASPTSASASSGSSDSVSTSSSGASSGTSAASGGSASSSSTSSTASAAASSS